MKTQFENLKERYDYHNIAPPHKYLTCPICKEWKDFNSNPFSNKATINDNRQLQQSK